MLFPIRSGLQHRGSRCGGIIYPLLFIILFSSPAHAALSETTYYIHQDHLGSVIAVSDESGNNVSYSKYAPYGNVTIEQFNNETMKQSSVTERGYTGQIKDNNTQLAYYNARYYDPVLSRFISGDSVNDQQNRYAYVGGNPVMRNDPGGNMFDEGGGKRKQARFDKEEDKEDSQVSLARFIELFSNPDNEYDPLLTFRRQAANTPERVYANKYYTDNPEDPQNPFYAAWAVTNPREYGQLVEAFRYEKNDRGLATCGTGGNENCDPLNMDVKDLALQGGYDLAVLTASSVKLGAGGILGGLFNNQKRLSGVDREPQRFDARVMDARPVQQMLGIQNEIDAVRTTLGRLPPESPQYKYQVGNLERLTQLYKASEQGVVMNWKARYADVAKNAPIMYIIPVKP